MSLRSGSIVINDISKDTLEEVNVRNRDNDICLLVEYLESDINPDVIILSSKNKMDKNQTLSMVKKIMEKLNTPDTLRSNTQQISISCIEQLDILIGEIKKVSDLEIEVKQIDEYVSLKSV